MTRLTTLAALGSLVLLSSGGGIDAGCYKEGHRPDHVREKLKRKDIYTGAIAKATPQKSLSDLPTSLNWCDKDGTSYCASSWNQHIPQYCGSCYVHGALHAANDRLKIQLEAKHDLLLARQVILNCAPHHGLGNGCDGGEAYDIFEYMYRYGLPDESCQNYVAKASDKCDAQAVCANCMPVDNPKDPEDISVTKCWAVKNPILYYVKEYGKISGEEAIMSEIEARGPVTCGFASIDDFDYNYNGGIYHDLTNATEVNHDVEVVGWGEESGIKYWIARNSWGTYWGENSFFRIVRGINNMRFEEDCVFAVFDASPVMSVLKGEMYGSMYGIVKSTGNTVISNATHKHKTAEGENAPIVAGPSANTPSPSGLPHHHHRHGKDDSEDKASPNTLVDTQTVTKEKEALIRKDEDGEKAHIYEKTTTETSQSSDNTWGPDAVEKLIKQGQEYAAKFAPAGAGGFGAGGAYMDRTGANPPRSKNADDDASDDDDNSSTRTIRHLPSKKPSTIDNPGYASSRHASKVTDTPYEYSSHGAHSKPKSPKQEQSLRDIEEYLKSKGIDISSHGKKSSKHQEAGDEDDKQDKKNKVGSKNLNEMNAEKNSDLGFGDDQDKDNSKWKQLADEYKKLGKQYADQYKNAAKQQQEANKKPHHHENDDSANKQHGKEASDQWKQSGQDIANEWKQKAEEWKQKGKDAGEEWKNKANEWKQQGKDSADDWKTRGQEIADEWKQKAQQWKDENAQHSKEVKKDDPAEFRQGPDAPRIGHPHQPQPQGEAQSQSLSAVSATNLNEAASQPSDSKSNSQGFDYQQYLNGAGAGAGGGYGGGNWGGNYVKQYANQGGADKNYDSQRNQYSNYGDYSKKYMGGNSEYSKNQDQIESKYHPKHAHRDSHHQRSQDDEPAKQKQSGDGGFDYSKYLGGGGAGGYDYSQYTKQYAGNGKNDIEAGGKANAREINAGGDIAKSMASYPYENYMKAAQGQTTDRDTEAKHSSHSSHSSYSLSDQQLDQELQAALASGALKHEDLKAALFGALQKSKATAAESNAQETDSATPQALPEASSIRPAAEEGLGSSASVWLGVMSVIGVIALIAVVRHKAARRSYETIV